MLNREERAFYARQLRLPELGEAGQARLRQARVLVVGAGGLGCPVLQYLAAAGVGSLRICEHDQLELHNLHRQPLYGHGQIGQPKGRLARQRLQALNPHLVVEWSPLPFSPALAADLLAGMDLVLDCADSLALSFQLGAACHGAGLPLVGAAVHRWEGQLLTVDPAAEAGCLDCLWPVHPPEPGACAEAGILGTVPGLLGTLQAQEALKLLLGLPGDLRRHVLLVDALDFSTTRLERRKRGDCPVCGQAAVAEGSRSISDAAARPDSWEVEAASLLRDEWRSRILVDLRERDEPGRPLPADHRVLHRPLSELGFPDHGLPVDHDLLLVCAHGVRSLWVCSRLRALGHQRNWSLRGGAEGLGRILDMRP